MVRRPPGRGAMPADQNCGTEIKLNESLAAPLITATKQEYETKLAEQSAGYAKRQPALHDRADQLANVMQTSVRM
ncbi:hypothetical protein HNQ40_001547 [Algisphaera agarilytica]|uniref:Uncharacterized protein n=1 Tax=Algisphaera agarilytica TaxID=1385975 RepID=A0A7X0H7W9_9BACT|nr:hypothetical protein [Algisphaera agarilytica]